MVVVSWWWSVVYNMSYFAMNMIVFYIRDRNLFFSFVVLVWVLLGPMGGDEWFWDGRGWGWRIEGVEGLDLGLWLRDWDLRG